MRYESRRKIFNLPIVTIAKGPNPERTENRGFVTIGDISVGVISFGGLAFGVLAAVGGMAIGYNAVGVTAIGVRFFEDS